MTGEHDEALGRLGEELAAALAAGESIAFAAWAERFAVAEADVAACVRALQALDLGLGEELADGWPEVPAPRLPDDYELVGEVGRGGMGVVYRAHQRSLGRDVAIKVLRPGDLVFGDALRRFRSEARNLARLRHRHIVSVHDLGESPDGTVWFAMDLIDGSTLADELARARRFLPSRAVRTLRQVAAAVVHAHSHGIVHRDLKPQNVLLDAAGDAFVVDFGLARDVAAAGVRTVTGELLGTPAYMSPEQAAGRGDGVGEASDVWALGALLYELLTGRGPFAGKPLHETIRAILEDEPIAPRQLDARIPAALEAICLKALRKRPADRYPTALAFVEELERFADGREVLARPPSRVSRLWRGVQRRATSLAVAAIAVVGTLAVGSLWLPSWQRQELLAAAERLRADGHANAAIAALVDLQTRHELPSEERTRAGLALARAHNDVAAERLFAGDRQGAEAAARQALAVAAAHDRDGALHLFDEVEDFAPWQWQLARARALVPPPPLPPGHHLRWPVLVPFVRDDLRSGRPAHVVLAGLAVAKGEAAFTGLADAERAAAFEPCVVAVANLVAAGDVAVAAQWPLQWTGRDHDTWWSPALEVRLAELATAGERPELQRAVALQLLCRLAGLPAPATPSASDATVAPALVAAWRTWQSLPIEDRLRARVDWLVGAIRQPEHRLSETAASLLPTLRSWLGPVVPEADPQAWWTTQRAQPYAQLLRNGLQLQDAAAFEVVTLLDRSATSPEPEAMLWRQLAWLAVPGAAPLPMIAARSTLGGGQWRQRVLDAAGVAESARHVVRAAVLRFDDGSPVPQLVAQAVVPARVGAPLQIALGTFLADTPILSLRDNMADEYLRTEHRLPWHRPEHETWPLSPRFGECRAELRGELALDREGLRFEGRGSLAIGLPDRFGADALATPRRVWLGGAASWDGRTVIWDRGRRSSTFVCLAHVGEESGEAAWALEDWRQAVVRGLQAAANAPAGALQQRFVDWSTPAWWSMPEAAAALQQLDRAQPSSSIEHHRTAALAMAGVLLAEPARRSAGPSRGQLPQHVRIALGTPAPAVRDAELAALVAQSDRVWTAAMASNLQRGAAAAGFALPPQLVQELAETQAWPAVLSAFWKSDRQGLLWLLVLLVVAVVAYPPARNRAAAMGWRAVWLILASMGLRVQIGGVIWTPTFLLLSVALLVALAGAPNPWRRWHWSRWLGFASFGVAVLSSVVAWLGFAMLPVDWMVMALLGTWLLVRGDESSIWAAWRASRAAARQPLGRRSTGRRLGGG